jgi:hypothetical protein
MIRARRAREQQHAEHEAATPRRWTPFIHVPDLPVCSADRIESVEFIA